MKKIIAISLISVFAILQYGKMVSWLYCELRVEITDTGKPVCDCEKILTDNIKDSDPAPLSHSHNHKEKLNEPFASPATDHVSQPAEINTGYFGFYFNHLQKGFSQPLFHPPALIA